MYVRSIIHLYFITSNRDIHERVILLFYFFYTRTIFGEIWTRQQFWILTQINITNIWKLLWLSKETCRANRPQYFMVFLFVHPQKFLRVLTNGLHLKSSLQRAEFIPCVQNPYSLVAMAEQKMMQLLLIYDRPTATEIYHPSTPESRHCTREIKIHMQNEQPSEDCCKHAHSNYFWKYKKIKNWDLFWISTLWNYQELNISIYRYFYIIFQNSNSISLSNLYFKWMRDHVGWRDYVLCVQCQTQPT